MDHAKFQPPAPGAWELESAHMQRPLTRWMQPIFPTHMMRGFKDGTARYGALLSHIEVRVVEGFVYLCPRPVGAPEKAKGVTFQVPSRNRGQALVDVPQGEGVATRAARVSAVQIFVKTTAPSRAVVPLDDASEAAPSAAGGRGGDDEP